MNIPDSPSIFTGSLYFEKIARAVSFQNVVALFALVFALTAATLVGTISFALDYNSAVERRGELQRTMDAAVLAGIRANVNNDQQRLKIAKKVFETSFDGPKPAPSLTFEMETDDIIAGFATYNSPTSLSKAFGISQIPMKIKSRATLGEAHDAEIAMVLDTTGSMSGSKISTLKSAASQLAQQIFKGENVKIAVVPFSRYVNIGTGNRNLPGLNIPPDDPGREECHTYTTYTNGECSDVEGSCCESQSCNYNSKTCYNDGSPYECGGNSCSCTSYGSCTQTSCEQIPNGTETSCSIVDDHYWHGCMGSREAGQDSVSPSHGDIPGLLDITCGTPISRLTGNQSAVLNTINSLSANDDTFIATGAIWGWRTLSHEAPFRDAVNPTQSPKTTKTMILMTDGANTVSKNTK